MENWLKSAEQKNSINVTKTVVFVVRIRSLKQKSKNSFKKNLNVRKLLKKCGIKSQKLGNHRKKSGMLNNLKQIQSSYKNNVLKKFFFLVTFILPNYNDIIRVGQPAREKVKEALLLTTPLPNLAPLFAVYKCVLFAQPTQLNLFPAVSFFSDHPRKKVKISCF